MIYAEIETRVVEAGKEKHKKARLSIPDHASEIRLIDFVRFTEWLRNQPDFFVGYLEASPDERPGIVEKWGPKQYAKYYLLMADSIGFFCGANQAEILSLPIKSESQHTGHAKANVHQVFNTILNAVGSYQPGPRDSFCIEGETYLLPTSSPSHQVQGANLTLGETIEALQAETYYSAVDESGNLIMENARYHIDLAVVAATCRKVVAWDRVKGEKKHWFSRAENIKKPVPEIPPSEPEEWDNFFAQRLAELEGKIMLDVALDVDFFLLNSKSISRLTLSSALLSKAAQVSPAWKWLPSLSPIGKPGVGTPR